MAGRDERVKPATRNYVIFGLLLVVALALAARDRYGPHRGRGEADSALRLMIVGGSSTAAGGLDEVDGFSVLKLDAAETIALGRELVDDDAPAYAAAIAYADQRGYGFVALAVWAEDGEGPSWELDAGDEGIDALPPPSVRYVVFSVGDLAPEGPRMRWVELAPLTYETPLAELDGIRLALYEHPDLRALWEHEPTAMELQAREVLRERDLFERHETLIADQQRWRELSELWPAPGVIPGSLAGPWEQVQAAPVTGGVLVQARAARAVVSVFRRPRLELDGAASLWFVPLAALRDDDPDESLARRRCRGLPDTLSGEISVAPDGASLVLRASATSPAQVFVFDEQAAREGACVARLASTLPLGERALGRPNAAGRMAWNYDDDWLHWFDLDSQHRAQIYSVDQFSGPWWVDGELLAMVAERPLGPPDYGSERVLVLLDTLGTGATQDAPDSEGPVRAELDAAALFFGSHDEPLSDEAALLDLRPSGADELLLLTEHCPQSAADDPRPCLHRLRSATPLIELTRALAADGSAPSGSDAEPPYTVETLGPLGPYLALAISAEGGRALWTAAREDGEAQLMSADLCGPACFVPRRIDDDALPDAAPRISADGAIALSEVPLELDELGTISVARAFVLPTGPPEASSGVSSPVSASTEP